jgi:protease IV
MSYLLALQRAASGAWRLLDGTRRALLNLLLLAVLVGLAWLALRPGPPSLKDKTALVLDLAGPVVEQRSEGTRSKLTGLVRGQGSGQVQLRDLLAVLDAATADPKISHAVLLLDDFAGAGLPTLREIASALDRFKAAGKPVYAWAPGYSQRQYFVAAHASEIWLDTMGGVQISGLGGKRNYYRDLLDRAGITANVVRAGKYKNAGESFSANAPSRETLVSDTALYDDLWRSWTDGVEAARKLPAGSVARHMNALPASLLALGGDDAKLAQEARWVDALKTRAQMRQALIERGRASEDGKTFAQVSFDAYLARLKPGARGDAVGVVVAQGLITDGQAGAGGVGGESTAQLIRQARDDKRIKALVLRVNSPGGSAYGSELVRREVQATRDAGIPVVVSMGDVAASGGYWVALAADEVWADAATITGSIGVLSMLPSAQGALDKLGVRTGGYSTHWLQDAGDPRRAPDPRQVALVQARVDRIYTDFKTLAATARKTTPEAIDAVAQGAVWTGRQALAHGLVDRNGSLGDALKAAATRAGMPAGHRVQYIERAHGRLTRALAWLGVNMNVSESLSDVVAALDLPLPWAAGLAGVPADTLAQMHDDLAWLAQAAASADGRAAAAVYCLCTAP